MRAKIEIVDSKKNTVKTFWYQGASGGRSVSRRIHEVFPSVNVDTMMFRLIMQRGKRVCAFCFIEPVEI